MSQNRLYDICLEKAFYLIDKGLVDEDTNPHKLAEELLNLENKSQND